MRVYFSHRYGYWVVATDGGQVLMQHRSHDYAEGYADGYERAVMGEAETLRTPAVEHRTVDRLDPL